MLKWIDSFVLKSVGNFEDPKNLYTFETQNISKIKKIGENFQLINLKISSFFLAIFLWLFQMFGF